MQLYLLAQNYAHSLCVHSVWDPVDSEYMWLGGGCQLCIPKSMTEEFAVILLQGLSKLVSKHNLEKLRFLFLSLIFFKK